MPQYFYTAKSLKGETKTGTMEAKDEHELARLLHNDGYMLISASSEDQETKKGALNLDIISRFFKVSVVDKMMFTRNLQVMVSAGISLPRAIRTLENQSRNKRFKEALLDISEEPTTGKRFSDGLAKHPDIFPELFLSMVRVGEEAGTLEEILKNLTHQMEREHELQSRIKGAMMYPAVIFCAMVGIGALMMVMVVPKLAETFKDMNIELPATTKIVMSLADFMTTKWYILIAAVIGIVALFRILISTKIGKRILDTVSLRMPLISPIVKKINTAYTARILGSLFNSGVPIVRALEITADTLTNSYFRDALLVAAGEVSKGSRLGDALKPYENLYSPMVIQMVEVGEETGETSSILQKLADFYEEEVAETTKNLSSVIEPIMMVIIGAAVGFFAVSMMQPLYGMLGSI